MPDAKIKSFASTRVRKAASWLTTISGHLIVMCPAVESSTLTSLGGQGGGRMKTHLWIVMASLLMAGGAEAEAQHDDYPALALRMRHEGQVRYHAEYGPDGRLTECTITKSSGYPELDAQTCMLAKRSAEAHPQISGSKDGTVKWTLPKT
ncbi:energy transducer TonB [Sphingomonas glacialis]|uniref:TonB family protein n=1 Tax=Sphingomonas glacialis TaxID=658225 RepID=A0A502FS10_9SPHN|nr:energy transducer TonB [Sphingomonas glacialis]TPG52201.1 TonB family protein [Sphingomonas glacialis]